MKKFHFFKKKGEVIVQGDLNARTGIDKDFIVYDKFDDVICVANSCNKYPRIPKTVQITPEVKTY